MVGFWTRVFMCGKDLPLRPGWTPTQELMATAGAYSQIKFTNWFQPPRHSTNLYCMTVNIKRHKLYLVPIYLGAYNYYFIIIKIKYNGVPISKKCFIIQMKTFIIMGLKRSHYCALKGPMQRPDNNFILW